MFGAHCKLTMKKSITLTGSSVVVPAFSFQTSSTTKTRRRLQCDESAGFGCDPQQIRLFQLGDCGSNVVEVAPLGCAPLQRSNSLRLESSRDSITPTLIEERWSQLRVRYPLESTQLQNGDKFTVGCLKIPAMTCPVISEIGDRLWRVSYLGREPAPKSTQPCIHRGR